MVSTLSSPPVINGVDAGGIYDFSEEEEREKSGYNNIDSDEDTEDASETDAAKLEEEYTEMKEQIYKEKLNNLKKQLQQVLDGTHPELCRKLKKLEQNMKERQRLAEVTKQAELEEAEKDYIREKIEAVEEFQQKKIDLKEHLIIDMEDKKRNFEMEAQAMELNGADFFEPKPVNTRKLRRRPNDPLPMPEKRRKPSPAPCHYLLSDEEIAEDLRILNKQAKSVFNKKGGGGGVTKISGKSHSHSSSHNNSHAKASAAAASLITTTTTPPTTSSITVQLTTQAPPTTTTTTSASSISAPKYNVRIEDWKLFYEKRWYHKNQNIYVESKEMGKVGAVITSIGQHDIWVRKVADNAKMRIWVSQMQKGKYKIRKRSK